MEECGEGELSADIAKIYTYPNHVLEQKPIKSLKLKVNLVTKKK
jgi:hypothetical protein